MSAGRTALEPDGAVLTAPGRAALARAAVGPVARPGLIPQGRAAAAGPVMAPEATARAQAAAAEPEVVR
ncbi:MAG: hypothetical protein H6730_00295 [Deltaproteobacteria bacterium]|nr:hypothetical protein [Deltaproteobacteria bacterium]